MSDAELIRFGKACREVLTPQANLGSVRLNDGQLIALPYLIVLLTSFVHSVTSGIMASKPEPSTSMNIRAVPILLLRQIKSTAALQGKTLREWVVEAIQEKIRREK
jgi:hypothetical protein